MKQYVIDQLRESDYLEILDFLERNARSTFMEGLFQLDLPRHLYSDIQLDHRDCQPYYIAVNLNRNRVAFEWLIRSREKLRCQCIAYADPGQRSYIINFADGMLEQLGIKI